MALNYFIIGGILTWLTFVIAAGIAHAHLKRGSTKTASSTISEAFKSVDESLTRIERYIVGKEKDAFLARESNSTTVHAALIHNILPAGLMEEPRLVIRPSGTLTEFQELITKEFGSGWVIMMHAMAGVAGWKKEENKPLVTWDEHNVSLSSEKPIALDAVSPVKRTPEEIQKKFDSGVMNFIYELQYAGDNFAKTPEQKKAMKEIIANIKQQFHGK